jgi:hypothetical protein
VNGDDKESQLYAIIGRAIADPEFRERLMNPESQADALAEHGLEWTESIQNGLVDADASIKALNGAFGINSIAS